MVCLLSRETPVFIIGAIDKPLLCVAVSVFLPGAVIVCHITGAGLDEHQKVEMIRYLRSVQREDGGWGL